MNDATAATTAEPKLLLSQLLYYYCWLGYHYYYYYNYYYSCVCLNSFIHAPACVLCFCLQRNCEQMKSDKMYLDFFARVWVGWNELPGLIHKQNCRGCLLDGRAVARSISCGAAAHFEQRSKRSRASTDTCGQWRGTQTCSGAARRVKGAFSILRTARSVWHPNVHVKYLHWIPDFIVS